jgi:hypothetical protein
MTSSAKALINSKHQGNQRNRVEEFDPQSFEFLLKEYDVLNDFYSRSSAKLQNRFNFYLVMLSAVIGAVTLVIQTASINPVWPLTLTLLVLFLCVTGLFFKGSVILLYADLYVYAKAISNLREYIAKHLPKASPPLYDYPFKGDTTVQLRESRLVHWDKLLWWLLPEGVFQFFIALINSICFSSIIPIVMQGLQLLTLRILPTIVATLVTFFPTLTIQNAYATIQKRQSLQRLDRRINIVR